MASGSRVPEAVAPLAMPGLDPSMAQAYVQMFQYLQQGIQPPFPFPGMTPYAPLPMESSIHVSVEGMRFQYQLTDDDLLKVFSRYGAVRKIRVDEAGGAATITFSSFQESQAAMQDLNGKVLNGLEGTLRIEWAAPPLAAPLPSAPGTLPVWNFPQNTPWAQSVPAATCATTPPSEAKFATADAQAAQVKGIRKYTCRFLIDIENDREFQVARRIIGAKGANMKRIVRHTQAKLRLRGLGSGYYEGAGQKESSEPLQLCVSCTNAEGYNTAVRQVEDLLKRIYEEYRIVCRETGRQVPYLQINLSENQLVYSSRAPGAPPLEANSKKEARRGRRSRKRDGQSCAVDRGEPGPNAPPIDEIERSIDDRNEARRSCNFSEADRIRDDLHKRGVALMDEPGGRGKAAEVTTWRYWRD
mmetsp:Transcript_29989/g.80022  ORF Transcript_29989/g.80022 Transcript_29989/m.80022 type:complete len:414 (-) Transcript_29989:116-1357(-)